MSTTKKGPGPWTDDENAAVIRLYFDMLGLATAGHAYNKAGMIRSYQYTDEGRHAEALSARSRGSVELKLMNASACHRDVTSGAATTMDGYGYRCLPNYQATLKVAMASAVNGRETAIAKRINLGGAA